LAPACLPDGTIDAAHPAAVAWAEARGIDPASLLVADEPDAPPRGTPAPGPGKTPETPATTGPTAEDFTSLSYRRRAAEVAELESRVEVRARRLIGAEFVRQRVFGPVAELFHRLQTDFIATTSRSVGAAARAGGNDLELAAMLRSTLSRELARTQRAMIRGLDHCDAGPHPPPIADDRIASDDGVAEGRAVSDFAAAITAELGTAATPAIISMLVKVTARAASAAGVGSLESVLALQADVIPEATDTVARMLAAHVTHVRTRITTETQTAETEIDKNDENDSR
jgi:hypothetical protein